MQLLFSLVIMFLSSNCFAQFVEVSHREGFNNQFNEFVRGSNGQFVLGDWYSNGQTAMLYDLVSDSVIWESDYSNVVWDAFVNTDGNVVLFGVSQGCDFTAQGPIYRFEISPSGQVVDQGQIQFTVYDPWIYGQHRTEDHLYVFWNTVLKIDLFGNPVFETEYIPGISSFTEVIEGFGTELLGFTESGYLAQFDAAGNFVDTLLLPTTVNHAQWSPYDGLFLFSDSAFYLLDSTYTATNVSELLGMTGMIRDFIVDSAGIVILNNSGIVTRIDTSWSIGVQSNLSAALNVQELWSTDSGIYCSGFAGEAGYILRLAEDLSIISDVQQTWMTVNDLNVFDAKVCVVGTENYNPHHQAPSALYKTFTTDLATAQPIHNVSLVGISIDSISSSNYSNVNYTYQYPSVQIVNEGTSYLQSVFVSYHNEPIGSGICEWQELRYELSGLNLGVGEDTIIQLPRIPYVSYSSLSGPTELTLCAYVYSPNRRMDANREYNKTCTVFSVNVSVAESDEDETMVYPNPFQDELIIEINDAKLGARLTVRDVLGQQVFSQPSYNGNRSVIQTSNWPDGIYLLTFESEHGSVIRKVVKR